MVDAAGQLGGLDVLVNNAGVFPPTRRWRLVGGLAGDLGRTLATNLTGAANATFCAVPHLIAAGGGAVVNVSSRGAFRGEPENPAYGASKAGLNAFGQSMAIALAPHGIAVGTVAPGFVQTEMAREVLDGPGGDAVRAQSPFGRVARPGGGGRGGVLARLARGAVRHRHDHRRQRRVIPAQLSRVVPAQLTQASVPAIGQERRTLVVGHRRHPAELGVPGLAHHRAAEPAQGGDRGVGVGDVEVDVPVRRHLGRLLVAEPPDAAGRAPAHLGNLPYSKPSPDMSSYSQPKSAA